MNEYDKLYRKYCLLLDENQKLKEENKSLRKQLGIVELSDNTTVFANACVTQKSSSNEKIALFRSLFAGRDDVFARRWCSKMTGKSGYQPVCENEWADGVCDKQKYKCSVCPNRNLMPLTDGDIYKHLSGKDEYGRDVVGIYPMLKDETCNFLCADFDEENYRKDVTAVRKICEKYNIPTYVEISRSGNGAHIWIFFESPISAVTARKLGSGILTKAMESNANVSFKSYDRLFPNQDTMPKGGFGNLIALPLQGKARRAEHSVFVDDNFVSYSDQWAYLSQVKKMSADKVETLMSELCKSSELGMLVSDSDEKPWEIKKEASLTELDFPNEMNIVRANMIYIHTKDLSPVAQNRIKRLAAFKNPDFYRAQAMRLPIYNKPRIICTAEITEKFIALPRGCENALCELLDSYNVNYKIEDKTNPGNDISVTFDGTLREEQQLAADALLEHNTGVLSATTAFGKTVIASYLIGKRKVNTLILVHTQSLMQQWKKSLEQFLNIDVPCPEKQKGKCRTTAWSVIGQLGSGKNTLNGITDIAIMQSLVSGDEVKELVRNYGMIIIDECHHVPAVNFEKILKFVNAKYVYGLTATPTRQDGHHPIIFMQCGLIRYRVDAKQQAEKRNFDHYLIPRFTSYRSISTDKGIAAIYRDLAENEIRNAQIINDVEKSLEQNRSPIILTERREHVLLLADKLQQYCKNIITLFGTASQKEHRETIQRLEAIPDNEPILIIATGKYVGEGFDYPRLDTLFLALPIAWKGKVAQYAGRLHRNYPGKSEVQIYDYVDIHIPVLERIYQKRIKGYSAIGYRTKVDGEPQIAPDLIYDGKSFYPVFCDDIKRAKKEVLIVSPFMRKNRTSQLIRILSVVISGGVTVSVVTRPSEDFSEKDSDAVIQSTKILQGYGVNVIYKSGFHQKFTVIDGQIVWYGSINFLSYGAADESIMRFTDSDVAGQLMDTVL